MRNRIERLRRWLLGGAVLLLVVLAVFIQSARYLRRHFVGMLPARLGVNVKSDASGFTYSQSVGSRTVYTIHAAKEVEHTDGTITLHDVNMVLYGAKGDRADQINGDEFQYDQKAGVVRAIGLVHIALQAAAVTPVSGTGPAASIPTAAANAPKVVHATTSGLVYLQKLGVAATSERIEFQVGQMSGHATGADYNTDSGVLMLHSAVSMAGIAGGHPVTLTAGSAQLDHRGELAYLRQAKYESSGRTVGAQQATLHTRQDGSLERIEAQGDVTLVQEGTNVRTARADVMLAERGGQSGGQPDGNSQPKSALLSGGVLLTDDEPLRQRRGEADQTAITFDAQGSPEHAVFTGSVHMVERTRATESGKEPWSVQELTAAKVDTLLVPAGKGEAQLRDADASGSAHLTLVENGSLADPRGGGRTDLAGDDIKTHLLPASDPRGQPQLDTLAARGHTVLNQVTAEGIDQTSSGDTLDAKFRPGALGSRGAAGIRSRPAGADSNVAKTALAGSAHGGVAAHAGMNVSRTLLRAVQQGHVSMTRRAPAKSSGKSAARASPEAEDVESASAQQAVYDGDQDRVTLIGAVQLEEAGSAVWANQVTLDHQSGDAQASGGVKVDYLQQKPSRSAPAGSAANHGDSEPAHVLAESAEFKHAGGVATFHGRPARLWQGGSQVQAPVIMLDKGERHMTARGEGDAAPGAALPVRTLLVSRAAQGTSAAGGAAGKTHSQAVRVLSRELDYSDALRQAEFTGGVHVEDADGVIVAREAMVFLQPSLPAEPGAAAQPGVATQAHAAAQSEPAEVLAFGGQIERIVATGQIDVDQPGRLHATGERLVYTAADQMTVLTGTGAAPPKATDLGSDTSFTGAALRFHRGDTQADTQNSIEVLNTVPGQGGTGVRAHSDSVVHKGEKIVPPKNAKSDARP